jgi:hypothetical protein
VPQAEQGFDQVKFWLSRFGVILLQIAGAFFLFIGIVGVILPLIPGFPFLILSAMCFFAASELALLT